MSSNNGRYILQPLYHINVINKCAKIFFKGTVVLCKLPSFSAFASHNANRALQKDYLLEREREGGKGGVIGWSLFFIKLCAKDWTGY